MESNKQTVERLFSDDYWRGGGVRTVDGTKLTGEYPILAQGEMELQIEHGPKLHADYADLKRTTVIETPVPAGRPLPLILGNIVSNKLLRIVIDERVTGPDAVGRTAGDPDKFVGELAAIDGELEKPFAEQGWARASQAIGTLAVERGYKKVPAVMSRSVYYAHNALGTGALVGALAHYFEQFRLPERGYKAYRAFHPMAVGTTYDLSGDTGSERLQRVVSADKVEQTYYAAISDEAQRIADSLGRLLFPSPVSGFTW